MYSSIKHFNVARKLATQKAEDEQCGGGKKHLKGLCRCIIFVLTELRGTLTLISVEKIEIKNVRIVL